ncbi:breast cancer anti-estrogen resistance protein 3 homolog [Spea bombifrons]|uniref:breast cancer anti-estrogen resistance protein 3 homolog n=1 Tax=Spea bombifrons TaxID=233779 RepID=UPI00234AAE71|nr:breast cancer anti-estrogen resistance protein 3 homolog [Spea bombifrons]
MPLPCESLRKELEEELKLNSEDLRSHAWYHGPLSRQEAERILRDDGDFLIRDSFSSLGDYVLSCCWSGQPLHFKIIAVTLRPKRGRSRTLYQLEQEQFDNIPALVRSYVGDKKMVSESSGAVIVRPVNRDLPLSALRERHNAQQANREARRTEGNLLRIKDRFGSQPGNLDVLKERPLQGAQSCSNLLTTASGEASIAVQEQTPVPLSPIFRTGSDPVLRVKAVPAPTLELEGSSTLRGSDSRLHSKAPPKPIRAPSILLPETSEGTDTYWELIPKAPVSIRKHVDTLMVEERWKNRLRATETTFGFLECNSPGDARPIEATMSVQRQSHITQDEDDVFVRPQIQNTSSYQPHSFQSVLLSPENKPLEASALRRLKEIVSHRDCRESALHILREDCQEIRIWGVSPEQQKAMGVKSGLELLTLPHGQQLRRDLLERHHLLCLGIAVDILGCTGAVTERAHTVHRIIQLAAELRDSAGDLFAFSAVMKALMLPQVTRLEQTWQMLRQTHTESAIAFQKQLKPALRALDEGLSLPSSDRIVVPYILPVLRALEGDADWGGPVEEGCGRLLRVLNAARSYTANAELLRDNADAKLKGFQPQAELREAFQTEFALRLFWGSKGAAVAQNERYKTFDKVLSVLSQKLEPEIEGKKTGSPVYGIY